MKIQCPCGAKYAFDVTPDMAQRRVEFICSACGRDSSDAINELIRRELAADSSSSSTVSLPAAAPAAAPEIPVAAAAPASTPARVQVRVGDAGRSAATAAALKMCPKHPGQRVTSECVVCHRPICPKCMQLFGYVCSPHCREKAELQGIEIPVFEGQRDVVQRKQWRKMGLIGSVVSGVVLVLAGVWFWYAWFGSVPSPTFSVRFAEAAYSGSSSLGADHQLVFLHGGTLARYDIKSGKEIWSRELLDKDAIAKEAESRLKQMTEARDRAIGEMGGEGWKLPSLEKVTALLHRAITASMELYVRNHNVWVAAPGKLIRFDWETGNPVQTLDLDVGSVNRQGDELSVAGVNDSGQEIVTHVNLDTGAKSEQVLSDASVPASALAASRAGSTAAGAGLSSGQSKSLDPNAIAAEYPHMSFAQKLALPATLSVARNQERALNEMREDDNGGTPHKSTQTNSGPVREEFRIIPTADGVVQFSARLLETKYEKHTVMKAPPKKSALNGAVNVTKTAQVANEILNEMQRNKFGDTEVENVSLYRVTIRCPDKDVPEWQGEVNGPPTLYPLKTVNVVGAGKSITVLDKQNKLLWTSKLNYKLPRGVGAFGEDVAASGVGQGPCVERGDTLYVFDEGVLSDFDLATGNARWRLPTVGVSGLYFDGNGMLYASSTSANPESLKYSRQIDITTKVKDVLLKIDPRNGKILWSAEPGGAIAYVSGKYIYTLQSYQPVENDSPYHQETGLETPAYMRIKRISPKNGTVMWEYFQQRAPLDVQFDQNLIQVVFRKEVQVLKYLSL